MPPRRPTRPAPPDPETLRADLARGKIVRVGIAPSDQFPDGVTGRVRRIGDPAIDGDEFLYVEVLLGGAKDVLPFAPKDLIGAPSRRKTAAPKPEPEPELLQLKKSPTTGRPTARSLRSAPAAPAKDAPDEAAPTAPATGRRAPTAPATGRRASAAGKGKRAPVAITISTDGDESAAWRIEARVGTRVAVRPTVVPPSRVWEIVQSLGEPKLTLLVQTLLEDHRRSTQARADALAAQLSMLQAELSLFPADHRS